MVCLECVEMGRISPAFANSLMAALARLPLICRKCHLQTLRLTCFIPRAELMWERHFNTRLTYDLSMIRISRYILPYIELTCLFATKCVIGKVIRYLVVSSLVTAFWGRDRVSDWQCTQKPKQLPKSYPEPIWQHWRCNHLVLGDLRM